MDKLLVVPLQLVKTLGSSCAKNNGPAIGGGIVNWVGIISCSALGYSQGAWLNISWNCLSCCSSNKGRVGEITARDIDAVLGGKTRCALSETFPALWGPFETPCTFASDFTAEASVTAATSDFEDSTAIWRVCIGGFPSECFDGVSSVTSVFLGVLSSDLARTGGLACLSEDLAANLWSIGSGTGGEKDFGAFFGPSSIRGGSMIHRLLLPQVLSHLLTAAQFHLQAQSQDVFGHVSFRLHLVVAQRQLPSF